MRWARRALAFGTLYAVIGVGTVVAVLAYIVNVTSLSGVSSYFIDSFSCCTFSLLQVRDFRERIRSRLRNYIPEVTPADPHARADFKNFEELFTHYAKRPSTENEQQTSGTDAKLR